MVVKEQEKDWLLNVICNDFSVIYVTAQRCTGGQKTLDLRSGSQRHRYLVPFLLKHTLEIEFGPGQFSIIGSVRQWNWNCTHINLNNVIIWGIIPICKILAKTWHCLFCFGMRYSFWTFPLNRECALHLWLCEKKTRKTYFAGGLAGFSKTICSLPE